MKIKTQTMMLTIFKIGFIAIFIFFMSHSCMTPEKRVVNLTDFIVEQSLVELPSEIINRIGLLTYYGQVLPFVDSIQLELLKLPTTSKLRDSIFELCNLCNYNCRYTIIQSAILTNIIFQHSKSGRVDIEKAIDFANLVLQFDSQAARIIESEMNFGNYKLARTLNQEMQINEQIQIEIPVKLDSTCLVDLARDQIAAAFKSDGIGSQWATFQGRLIDKEFLVTDNAARESDAFKFRIKVKNYKIICTGCHSCKTIDDSNDDLLNLVLTGRGWRLEN